MRKIIVTEFYTIDGYMSDSEDKMEWVNNSFSPDMGIYVDTVYKASDILMLGGETYRIMSGYWPTADTNPDAYEGDAEFAAVMNNIRKVVFSKTETNPKWKNTVIYPELTKDVVEKLKQEDGKDILIAGSASIVQQLTDLNLIDEYHLLTHPVVLGEGVRLFKDGQSKSLKSISSEAFTNGVVLLKYQPA